MDIYLVLCLIIIVAVFTVREWFGYVSRKNREEVASQLAEGQIKPNTVRFYRTYIKGIEEGSFLLPNAPFKQLCFALKTYAVLVSNGTKWIDWAGFLIDSAREDVNAVLAKEGKQVDLPEIVLKRLDGNCIQLDIDYHPHVVSYEIVIEKGYGEVSYFPPFNNH